MRRRIDDIGTAPAALQAARAAVRRRRALSAFVVVVLIGMGAAGAVLRWAPSVWPVASLVLLIAAGAVAFGYARRIGYLDIARRLDARDRTFEDSTSLLFRDASTLNPLERIQQARLLARIDQRAVAELREPWPLRAIGAAALAALLLNLAIVLIPDAHDAVVEATPATRDTAVAPSPTITRVQSLAVDIAPPAYTGLPARTSREPDLRVEAGATLRWQIALAPAPAKARLVFHDGARIELVREGEAWRAAQAFERSTLYRIEIEGGLPLDDERLRRIDVIPDRAPDVRVLAPDRTLTLLEPQQRSWALDFEASDDYGLADARLTITLAQGSGENIEVKERTVALQGEGNAKARRYRRVLDLPSLGIAAGDDVIVRLSVRDNRRPAANETRTASFILRWPPESGDEGTGVEGLVREALPAYFRSQRQIIIDTEALIAERAKLADDAFMTRADTIGVDQRILRLRYGQFLGEEASDAPDGDHAEGEGEASHDEDAGFGGAGDVVGAFGHTHDEAEAATLLDPETRKILKAALSEMWDAELHLRQGAPQEALPYEYRALELIKRVQQASRIYLARVGLELPPIDASRRLTGDRTDARGGRSALVAAERDDAPLADAWTAISRGERVDLDALQAAIAARDDGAETNLPAVAALDRVRREPTCSDCLRALGDTIWPMLGPATPRARLRDAPDAAGRAYLEALEREGEGGTP